MDTYLYAGRTLLPEIYPLLENNEAISHDHFKVSCFMVLRCVLLIDSKLQGALHVILLSPMMSVFLHDWKCMKDTLPVIIKVLNQLSCVNTIVFSLM